MPPNRRYGTEFRETSQVPGQLLPRGLRRYNQGTPHNCRGLLRKKPPAPKVCEPKDIPIPPGIKAWVPEFLTPYQREGIAFGLSRPDVNLWWSPGAGKTLGSIYLSLCRGGPILVVTNANVRNQFARAFEEFTDGIRSVVLEGQTPKDIPAGTRVVVISWEILCYWRRPLIAFLSFGSGTIILDEVHKAKAWRRVEKVYDPERRATRWVEKKTSRSAAAAAIAKHAAYRIALTATPFRNTLMDLWSQLDILEPMCWGTSKDYAYRYCDAKDGKHGGLDTTGQSNTEELNTRLREVCHIVGRDRAMANLPPKRRQVSFVNPEQQVRPPSIKAELKAAARRGKNAVLEVRLAEAAARKRNWVKGVVLDRLEAKQKVVIFTGRRKDAERLHEALAGRASKLGAEVWMGHGEHSPKDREEMARQYGAAKESALLIGTIDAFGESIDGLQTTDFALFAMIPYTHGQVEQAEGRFIRLGQDRPVLICYAIAEGTVDDHVADLLLTKLDAVDATVA